jgi:hypothetical protein
MQAQALVARVKDPWLMRALYDACIAEVDDVRVSSSSSSSSSSAGSCLPKDRSSNEQSISLLDAMRLWVHLQV